MNAAIVDFGAEIADCEEAEHMMETRTPMQYTLILYVVFPQTLIESFCRTMPVVAYKYKNTFCPVPEWTPCNSYFPAEFPQLMSLSRWRQIA